MRMKPSTSLTRICSLEMRGSQEEEEGFTTPKKGSAAPAEPESALRQSIAAVFADATLTPAQKFARVNELRGLQVRTRPVPVVSCLIGKKNVLSADSCCCGSRVQGDAVRADCELSALQAQLLAAVPRMQAVCGMSPMPPGSQSVSLPSGAAEVCGLWQRAASRHHLHRVRHLVCDVLLSALPHIRQHAKASVSLRRVRLVSRGNARHCATLRQVQHVHRGQRSGKSRLF